jgi:AcrR family transcriptional regulator
MPAKKTRAYDATARRARAEEERRATRRRVVDAARHLFLTNGYPGTTMVDIATEAGVALQSVYTAAKSKADLLQLVVDTVVAGDDEPVQITDRDPFQAIGDEPDPVRQVEMIAALIASTQERSASVQVVFRQAAAVDDTIADNLDAELQRRHATFVTIIGMIPEEHLRHSREESADLAWAIGSSEVFLLLRRRRGWDADHYVRTLTDVLVHQLLVPDRVS